MCSEAHAASKSWSLSKVSSQGGHSPRRKRRKRTENKPRWCASYKEECIYQKGSSFVPPSSNKVEVARNVKQDLMVKTAGKPESYIIPVKPSPSCERFACHLQSVIVSLSRTSLDFCLHSMCLHQSLVSFVLSCKDREIVLMCR